MNRPVDGHRPRHPVPDPERGLDELYVDGHRRVSSRLRALLAEGRLPAEIPVTACPGWSVHSVVSHMSAITVDALAGRLAGVPDDAWTARQVADRADRPTADLLDEWAPNVEVFAAAVSQSATGLRRTDRRHRPGRLLDGDDRP